MNLIVNATGNLGRAVADMLKASNKPVRSVVRPGSPKRAELESSGIECVTADLRDPATLGDACRGARTVVSMATAIVSQDPANNLENVDRDGQLALVDAAKASGVEHFVFVSFPPANADFPLQTFKRAVEERVRSSGMAYTLLQPTNFTEVWLSPMLGFDPVAGTARIFGKGDRKVSWISAADVARFTVAAVDNPAARNKVLELGGPDALSQLEVVSIFEAIGKKKIATEHVPEDALEAQLRAAQNPVEASFAGLMLSVARSVPVDNTAAYEALGVGDLVSVEAYARRLLGAVAR